MRPIRLARVALDAETLRWRRIARRAARRGIYAAVAALFGVAAISLLHALAFLALRDAAHLTPAASAAILLGADALLALAFGLLAAGALADPVELEARLVRDQALAQMRRDVTGAITLRTITTLVSRLVRARK